MSELPRGIRNNNPGNLRWGVDWLGLTAEPYRTDPDFCQFVSDWCGLRALGLTLITYRRKHGLKTIRAMIERYAPGSENDTGAYIDAVAHGIGHGPDSLLPPFDIGLLMSFFRAITRHENGAGPRVGSTWYPTYLRQAAAAAAFAYANEHF